MYCSFMKVDTIVSWLFRTGLLYNRDPFALGSLIPDDGGSTHL
jgi:hypothetical protein